MRRKRTVMIVGEYTRTKKKYIIEVDGQQYEAIYCGKGQYSKVYRVGDRVIMYTEGDCTKEALALYQYDRVMHIPEMIRHENITVKYVHHWYVFSTPYYRDVNSKDRSAWILYKKMQKFFDEHYTRSHNRFEYEMMYKFVVLMAEEKELNDNYHLVNKFPRSVIKALNTLIDIGRNCGDNIRFDFKKSNFGVDRYGTLIFRDLLYVYE